MVISPGTGWRVLKAEGGTSDDGGGAVPASRSCNPSSAGGGGGGAATVVSGAGETPGAVAGDVLVVPYRAARNSANDWRFGVTYLPNEQKSANNQSVRTC